MSGTTGSAAGSVAALWRYPVKSMLGEVLSGVEVRERGLSGDRAFALLDRSDGKVATAKNPRKWPDLFAYRATLEEFAGVSPEAAHLRITLPDGREVNGAQGDASRVLSKTLGRDVTLVAAEPAGVVEVHSSKPAAWSGKAEQYWPDLEGLEHRDAVTEFTLPEGTLFDGATIHLLTTATLERLRSFYPGGRFEAARFRPNIVIEGVGGGTGFVEDSWIGHTLAIGDQVRLTVTRPCGRCVMTTLPQGDLPHDRGILGAVIRHSQSRVGVYAVVVRGGFIRRGDPVRLGATAAG